MRISLFFVMISIFSGIFVTTLFLLQSFANSSHNLEHSLERHWERPKEFSDWQKIIFYASMEGTLKPTDFEKIDFALPGDDGYGDDPENEFFNPAGKFKAKPIPKSWLEQWTTSKKTRVVFNIRRDPTTKIHEILYAIVPNIKGNCSEFSTNGNVDPLSGVNFELAPDNHSVVHDPYLLIGGCVHGQNNKVFYFEQLAVRRKDMETNEWVFP